METRPITCLRPVPERAAQFAAPPYDVFDDVSARTWLDSHPGSFLAIDLPEATFNPDEQPDAAALGTRARAILDERIADGTLVRDDTPCYYVYRLIQDGHEQTGIICAFSVADYEDGTIRRHEATRTRKLADRIGHIRALDAQTGPIYLTCIGTSDEAVLGSACNVALGTEPLYDYEENGIRETIWRVGSHPSVLMVHNLLATISGAYIADGHHRAAAAAAIAESARSAAQGTGELESDFFLAILFKASQLKIHAYNRVVFDRAGMDVDALVHAVRAAGFVVVPSDGPVIPEERRRIGMFSDGRWWEIGAPEPEATNPASSLDVSILQDRLLSPVLGISDPTRDERICFVSGVLGTEELERLAGTDGVAFSMFPTTVEELAAVADAGMLMPPKSTWFAPKPRSGLFIRQLQDNLGDNCNRA